VTSHNEWDSYLWSIHSTIKNDIYNLEIFCENMYAVHSIEYEKLPSYFFVFAIRQKDMWLH